MRKRNFTLVEMLTVIAIIGVLAGILIPTVTIAKRRAQEAQARTEVNSIVAAIKAYRQQYNKYPSAFASAEGEVNDYEGLMKMLCGDEGVKNSKKTNPRKTKFLTPRAKKSEAADKTVYAPEVWLDPWGRLYCIFLDNEYDGKVTIKKRDLNSKNEPVIITEDLTGDIFVYSYGIEYNRPKDDVISWVK